MIYKLCTKCGQPMLKKGQKRKHPDAYRHADGCPYDRSPQLIEVRITRAEFRMLPLKTRRRILKEQAAQLAHEEFLNTIDCEEDP